MHGVGRGELPAALAAACVEQKRSAAARRALAARVGTREAGYAVWMAGPRLGWIGYAACIRRTACQGPGNLPGAALILPSRSSLLQITIQVGYGWKNFIKG
jgi:hypothetical protein